MHKIIIIIGLLITHITYANDDSHKITFHTSYPEQVTNDLMVVNMSIVEIRRNHQQVVTAINEKSAKIKTIINAFSSIKFQTTNYSTYPQYKNNTIKNWRGTYYFKLESSDFKSLATALEKLQTIATYNRVNFKISADKKNKLYDKVLTVAIKKHHEKAKHIADNFGATNYRFITTNINKSNKTPYRFNSNYASHKQATRSNTAPTFESGKSNITINITSTISLTH